MGERDLVDAAQDVEILREEIARGRGRGAES